MREDNQRRLEQRREAWQSSYQPIATARQPNHQQQRSQPLATFSLRNSRITLSIIACVLVVLVLFGMLNASNNASTPSQSYDLGPGPGAPVRVYTGDSSLITPSPLYSSSSPYDGGSSGGSTCADGTHSSSTGRGTCSHHGGVAGH